MVPFWWKVEHDARIGSRVSWTIPRGLSAFADGIGQRGVEFKSWGWPDEPHIGTILCRGVGPETGLRVELPQELFVGLSGRDESEDALTVDL
jgi:hypothetical protein